MLCTLLSDVLAALSGTKGVRGLIAACIIMLMTAEPTWTLFTAVACVTEAACWAGTTRSGSCWLLGDSCFVAAEDTEPFVTVAA